VMPIVSTVLGVVALGEPLRWYQPIGAVVIIAGAVLAQARNRAAPAPADGDDLSSVLLRRPASAAPRSTRAWD
jgi:hypothetical protein